MAKQEEKAEKAQADAEAKAKVETEAKAKAKVETEAKAKAKVDKTPDQALRDDWPSKHKTLAPYITIEGRMRGGLKPSDQEKAKEILKRYGF